MSYVMEHHEGTFKIWFYIELNFLEFIQNQQMILKEETCLSWYVFYYFIYYLCVSKILTPQVNVQPKFYQVDIL